MACYTGKMNRSSESGNVLFLILVGVMLFAALSYTVAQMLRSGNADAIGDQQASLYADEILDYARTLRQTVQSLKISNGCENEDISFENSVVAGYTNGTNTSCQVFHADGGALTFQDAVSNVTSQDWYFSGGTEVIGIGTLCGDENCTEIIAVLPNINIKICQQINDKMGIDDSVAGDVTDNVNMVSQYTGDLSYQNSRIGDAAGNLAGKTAGCMTSAGSPTPAGSYAFYQVLVAR